MSLLSQQPPFILLKRPFLLIVTFLIPGLVVGHYLHAPSLTVYLFLPLLVFFALAVLLLATHSTYSTPVSMLLVFWVGFLLGVKTNLLPSHHVLFQLKADSSYELRGTVVEEPVPVKRAAWQVNRETEDLDRYRFTLKASKARGRQSEASSYQRVTGKLLVYASGDKAGRLQYGDRVVLTGKVFLPERPRNPGGFGFRKYQAQNDIHLCMRADSISGIAPGHGNPIICLLSSLENKLRGSLSSGGTTREQKSFLRAIILGERREVAEEFREALRRTNTMHILAISGLHVGILAAAIYFFLSRLLFVPQAASSLITLFVLAAYALLTGMRPPVFRAFLMSSVFLLAPLLKKRSDVINSLAFAAAVILCIRPGDLFTAGFQLSFMVVLSILLLSDKIFCGFVSLFRLRPDPGFLVVSRLRRRIYRILEYPLRLFSVSLSAFLGSLPLMLYYFHHISLLSPFCNMLILVLVGFIVPLGFLAGVIGLLTPAVAGFINTLNGPLISALQGIVTFFSSLSFASFNAHPPSLISMCAFYAVVLAIGFARSLRRAIIPIAVSAILAATSFVGAELARRHPNSVEITFLDVGQGDCAFVEFPDGQKMLVDGGSVTRTEIGRYVIVPFLRWHGVNKLDAIVISHYDSDHINGLDSVLDEIRVRKIIVRSGHALPDSSAVRKLNKAIGQKTIPLQKVRAGDKPSISPRVIARVLNPPAVPDLSRFSENDLSIVLSLAFRSSSALFCGDIEKRAERLVLQQPFSPRGDVLKVAHHGSNSSSSEEFIRRVSPKLAIISCGQGNAYGHPSPQVLERYQQLGVRVFRTDRDGAIVVEVFPHRLIVTTAL